MKRIILILVLLMPMLSFALKSDEQKPLQIDANKATLDQKQMVTVFSGNLVIAKGSLTVKAEQGTATQDKNGDRTLDLIGKPVFITQMADDGEKIEGQGNELSYNTKTGLAVLTGRARIKKGKNVVIGDTLTYNTQTQVYSAQSGVANGITKEKNGRITVILDSQTNESARTKK